MYDKFIKDARRNMALDFEKLWKPYSRDNRLYNTFNYLEDEAKRLGISQTIVELAILQVFTQVAGGKKFSTTKCSCGCGIDKSGSDITHAMKAVMIELHRQIVSDRVKQLEKKINHIILEKASRTLERHIRKTKLGFWERIKFELFRNR